MSELKPNAIEYDHIPKREAVHKCKECGDNFKEYLYWENCRNCNDGETDEGYRCMSCGGKGEYEEWVTDICEGCLTDYLENER